MIHTIKIDGSYMPEGWVPVRFGPVRPGESFLNPDTTVVKWDIEAESYGLFLIVEREKWKPADGEKVWTFGPLVGVNSSFFYGHNTNYARAYENNFLFKTEAEAQHAYNETLKLMETMGETK